MESCLHLAQRERRRSPSPSPTDPIPHDPPFPDTEERHLKAHACRQREGRREKRRRPQGRIGRWKSGKQPRKGKRAKGAKALKSAASGKRKGREGGGGEGEKEKASHTGTQWGYRREGKGRALARYKGERVSRKEETTVR